MEETTNLGRSCSNVFLTEPLHSKSQIPREKSPLRQRHTSTSQVVEDNNDDKERDDSQPYSPRQELCSPSSISHAPVWSSNPIASEHSDISRAISHTTGEVNSTSAVPFSCWGSVNSTGSTRSSAVHHLGPFVPGQCRGSRFARSDTEHLPVQNHYLIVSKSNIALCEDSAPHPPPHDAWQSLVEAEKVEVGARHAEASAKMREAATRKKVADAKHKEVEAQRKLEEARQRELKARQNEEGAKRNEVATRKRDEEARWKEKDARRWEGDVRRRLEDARQRETLA